ncbi:MAG: hypothetical protein OXG46_14420 [Chloroflexi bacterium]|nr:hypothetical protein [Chloroflexota bacterium]MCY3939078.1 hypothetical protein [Chloroflexota bacterium]
MNLKLISFGAAIFGYDPPPGEKLRLFLEQWVGQFSTDDYCEDVSGLGAKAWSVDYDVAAQHIDLLGDRLSKVLLELKSL